MKRIEVITICDDDRMKTSKQQVSKRKFLLLLFFFYIYYRHSKSNAKSSIANKTGVIYVTHDKISLNDFKIKRCRNSSTDDKKYR